MSHICAWFCNDFSKVKTVQGFEMQFESWDKPVAVAAAVTPDVEIFKFPVKIGKNSCIRVIKIKLCHKQFF